MARYIGPRLRIVRRIGKLRGFTRKKPFRRVFRGKGPLKGKVALNFHQPSQQRVI